MRRPKTKIVALMTGLAVAVLCTLGGDQAVAQQMPSLKSCVKGSAYTALYTGQPDEYEVYARLGRRSQRAHVSVYYQPFDAPACRRVGVGEARGDGWTKVGQINVVSQDELGNFTLRADGLEDLPSVNRPTLLLVSRTNPACRPTNECYVSVSGARGLLRASGSLLNEDTLRVVTAKDPATDRLSKVDYYVDNRLAYSLPDVRSFDLRYVSSGQHTLATVATYASKQQVLITKQVTRPYYDQINYLAFTFWHQQQMPVVVAGGLLLAAIVGALVLHIVRVLYHRHLWKVTHFVGKKTKSTLHVRLHNSRLLRLPEKALDTLRPVSFFAFVLVSGLILVMAANTWVIRLFQVDGPSMQSTLQGGEVLVVNKLGKTIANMGPGNYVPKRGQIIIFAKERNVLFEPLEAAPSTYLVKRVIGLPGERIVVKKGVITVYDKNHPEGFNPDKGVPWQGVIQPIDTDQLDITLGPDELFVCGDNRAESIDSRLFGPVKLGEVIGDATMRLSPPDVL